MASTADHDVALLSIHPRFADAILNGTKRVEFRKARFSRDISSVLIYATSPVQRLVGWFEVDAVEEASPSSLWRRYQSVGGISRTLFGAYYRSSDRGVAIHVRKPTRLPKALPLTTLGKRIVPPQNYRYLPASALVSLIENQAFS